MRVREYLLGVAFNFFILFLGITIGCKTCAMNHQKALEDLAVSENVAFIDKCGDFQWKYHMDDNTFIEFFPVPENCGIAFIPIPKKILKSELPEELTK